MNRVVGWSFHHTPVIRSRVRYAVLMRRPNLKEDIKPVTQFRANAAALLDQVKRTKRALVLTQRGRSAAVLLEVGEYERLVEELELLRDIHTAQSQLAEDQGYAHDEARTEVLSALRR